MLRDIISGFVSLFTPTEVPQEDRRRVIRLRCRYSVYCIEGEKVNKATVIDMGLQGLRLETPEKYKTGSKVSLVYRGAAGQRAEVSMSEITKDVAAAYEKGVLCDVSWCDKDRYSKVIQTGVTYSDTPRRMSKSWVKTILKEIGFDEETIFQRRKIIRVTSAIPCRVEYGKKSIPGRAVNLGAGGALVQTNEGVNEETLVKINIGPYKSHKQLRLSGMVRTRRFDVPTNTHLQGIRFEAPSSDEADLLGRYVIDLLKEQTVS